MPKLFFLLLAPLLSHAAIDPVIDAADRRDPKAPALAQAVTSKLAKRRKLAAQAFGDIMSPESITPLTKLTKDWMPFVREEAAFGLGQLGWLKESAGGHEAEIRKTLAGPLHDKQASVRAAAVEALGKIGGEETSKLVAPAFTDKDPAVRASAAMAIFRSRMIQKLRDPQKVQGFLSDKDRERLLALARDPKPEPRLAAAYFFSRNAEPRAQAAMALLAVDKDPYTRLFAVMALGKMKAQKAGIDGAFDDPAKEVRVAAVGAAKASGAPVPARLLKDSFWAVRAAAAAAVKPEGEGLELLNNAYVSDESMSVRVEALKALAKKDPSLVEQAAKSPAWELREGAAQASDALGDARAKFLAAQLEHEKQALVRVALLEAYLALPGEDSYKQLEKSLHSGELSERATAVGALADRKEPGVTALAEKTYGEIGGQSWVETREDLVELMGKKEDRAGLRKALADSDRGVRAKARAALAALGEKDIPVTPDPPLPMGPFRDDAFRDNPQVEIETNKGTFTIELYALDAPLHTADFVGHVKAGFYDGLLWHRVIPNFVAQGGDPDGTGFGGAGYSLRAEINRKPFTAGALGMPRSQGFDTGGGQVFFSLVPTPHLDGQYTVFGHVVKGFEVLPQLERGDRIVKARILSKRIHAETAQD